MTRRRRARGRAAGDAVPGPLAQAGDLPLHGVPGAHGSRPPRTAAAAGPGPGLRRRPGVSARRADRCRVTRPSRARTCTATTSSSPCTSATNCTTAASRASPPTMSGTPGCCAPGRSWSTASCPPCARTPRSTTASRTRSPGSSWSRSTARDVSHFLARRANCGRCASTPPSARSTTSRRPTRTRGCCRGCGAGPRRAWRRWSSTSSAAAAPTASTPACSPT